MHDTERMFRFYVVNFLLKFLKAYVENIIGTNILYLKYM